MTQYPDLLVLRHGQTEWNLAGRFQGRRNSDLTALGRGQAAEQNSILASHRLRYPDQISSPQGRAVETAQIALGSSGFQQDIRLSEIAFGSWEGMTRSEIKTQISCSYDSHLWCFQSPGGESFAEISARVRAFMDDLRGPSIVVTHGVTSAVLRGLWLGLSEAELAALPKEQGCIYQLSDGKETTLRSQIYAD